MNIHGRIIARKVLLIWFYQKFFLLRSLEKRVVQTDVLKISKIVAPFPEIEQVDDEVKQKILNTSLVESDDEVAYILTQYFSDQDPSQVDFEYIRTIAPVFEANISTVEQEVDRYATSFKFKDMDVIDQMIFVLWYTEYTVLGTTKEVLLNEMIEIAKRYGDDASSKLINGIGHKMLSGIQKA
jgi:transcription antitermination protein NusB